MAAPSPALSVFQYSEPLPFLREVLEEKKRRGRGFSLRAWSRQLGYRTPSYLSAVLNGERRLQVKLAGRLVENLNLQGGEAERFELLVLRANAKDESEKQRFDRLLRRVAPDRKRHRLDEDRFALVADWYHWALLEMIPLADFRPDPVYLSKRLGERVRPELIEAALRRLVRLKLVRRRRNGTLERVDGETVAGDTVPSASIRAHHRQFLDKAKAALEDTTVERRDVRGSTFAFAPERVEEARTLIRDLHRQLRSLASDDGGEVYRFNSQLFPLTEGAP